MNIRKGWIYILLLTGMSLFASDADIDIKASIEWDRQKLEAEAILNLAAAGFVMPTGRAQAEELIDADFPRLIQSALLSILVDSSNTMQDLIRKNEYVLHSLSNLALSADRIPPVLSRDMQFLRAKYTIDLKWIRSELVKHRSLADIPRTLNPVPSRAYTGIVIFANEEIPVHGKQGKTYIVPCIFPKIWDSGMNLIYERNMVNPELAKNRGIAAYVDTKAVFRATPSGMDEELMKLVGNNPLRIMAKGVFGMNPTDPIIDRNDALLIISNEENRKLLQEGKVVIVLNDSILRKNL